MTNVEHQEQRRRRSELTQLALNYQLEHIREEFSMKLVVLADKNGLIVAYAGDPRAAEVFAVHAESLARGERPNPDLAEIMLGLRPAHIICESITLDDTPLYLCVVSRPGEETRMAFSRTREGIRRIYYTTGEFTD